MTKRALITGVTGQDGSYLAEHLLEQNYDVWGMVRGIANPKVPWLRSRLPDVRLVQGDLLDQSSLIGALHQAEPDEVYNLGALSFVPHSWQQPQLTTAVTGMGVLNMLEAIRVFSGGSAASSAADRPRFYQASSSEMFGGVHAAPQNETMAFHPRSPYGVAKVYGHHITLNYRESYGMYAVSGILFNHESPRRAAQFVTRKVSLGVARIKLSQAKTLRLGNLDARRDWGFAGDHVRAMHLMLQPDVPDTYVIGTGEAHSVRELVEFAFGCVGLDWREHVVHDETLLRHAEVGSLKADTTKARKELGWQPTMSFEDLIAFMVESDLRMLTRPRSADPLVSHDW